MELEGPADKVVLRLYLPSMVLKGQAELGGALVNGWNNGPVDLGGLPSGLYYVKAVAYKGGDKSPSSPAVRLVVLR